MTDRRAIRIWMKVTALLLVVLWPLATSHEWLESAGLIHTAAHGDADGFDHDAADGHCRLESAAIALKLPVWWAQPWLPVLVVAANSLSSHEPAQPTAPELSTAPPELRATWQFSERAARLSRAPSVLA